VRRRKENKAKSVRPTAHFLLWPMQGVALALFWCCCAATTPERAAGLGARLGRSIGPRLHRHRRLRDNLAVALPHATAEQVEGIARQVWGSFGATLAEYAHFETIADRAFGRHVDVVRHSGAEAAGSRGGSFILVTAHLGNWEIAAATARHLGVPLTVIHSPPTNPLIRRLLQRRRRVLGCEFLGSGAGIRPLVHELRTGRSIGLLVDSRVKNGAAVPFCAQATTTTLVPARLALKFGCPLVPVRVERLRPAHFRVTVHDPVRPDPALAPEGQARQMMATVNALFESWIAARPHEWQCFQNRWPRATRRRVLQMRTPGAEAS
jgi:KDO2-lipid IV(A) lauroyltransferase